MVEIKFSEGRSFLFRVPEGKELLNYINRFAEEHNVLVGTINAIGSLRNPKIGYFDENAGEYKVRELKGTFELVSLMGNISLKDGKPFAHIHVSLGGPNGRLYGGHMVEGKVFVAEVFIQELLGEPLGRNPTEKVWCSGKQRNELSFRPFFNSEQHDVVPDRYRYRPNEFGHCNSSKL